MLSTRIKTALFVLVPVLFILWFGGLLLVLFSLAVYVAVNYEFYAFATRLARPRVVQLTLTSLLLPLGYLYDGLAGLSAALTLASMIVMTIIAMTVEAEKEKPEIMHLMAGAGLGICYPGLLGSMLVVASYAVDRDFIIWLIGIVIFTDTLAYFGGSLMGGAQLSPRISPNKTVSGALCGVVAAAMASLLLARLLSLPFDGSFLPIAYGILIGVMATLGDLVESLIKRAYDAKDMGRLLPGHGGILDRIDGLIFATPVLFLLNI